MNLHFDPAARATIRSAANWGLAVAITGFAFFVVGVVELVAGLGELFEDGLGGLVLAALDVGIDLLALVGALALARACLGLRTLSQSSALDESLDALRSYFRIRIVMLLAFPVLLVLLLPMVLVLGPLGKIL